VNTEDDGRLQPGRKNSIGDGSKRTKGQEKLGIRGNKGAAMSKKDNLQELCLNSISVHKDLRNGERLAGLKRIEEKKAAKAPDARENPADGLP